MQRQKVDETARTSEAKEKFWLDHLDAQQKSSLTQAEYCRRNQLSTSSLGLWKRRLTIKQQSQFALVPVAVSQSRKETRGHEDNSPGLTLVIKGSRIEVGNAFQPSTLARLLMTLERL